MDEHQVQAIQREILRPLWKIHILHHAVEGPIIGNWMLEELREHGYRVSPGTLYPLLRRMVRLGWLQQEPVSPGKHADNASRPYRATATGRRALKEVKARLRELSAEMPLGHPS